MKDQGGDEKQTDLYGLGQSLSVLPESRLLPSVCGHGADLADGLLRLLAGLLVRVLGPGLRDRGHLHCWRRLSEEGEDERVLEEEYRRGEVEGEQQHVGRRDTSVSEKRTFERMAPTPARKGRVPIMTSVMSQPLQKATM